MSNPVTRQQVDMRIMEAMKALEMSKTDMSKPLLTKEVCLNSIRLMEEEKLAMMKTVMPLVRAGSVN